MAATFTKSGRDREREWIANWQAFMSGVSLFSAQLSRPDLFDRSELDAQIVLIHTAIAGFADWDKEYRMITGEDN